MRARHALQPYRLPDAGHWGVPNAVRINDLLAVGLRAFVGGIPYADDYFLRGAALEVRCDVEGKRIKAAFVAAYLGAVDIDFAAPIDTAKMEDHLARAQGAVDMDRSFVPQRMVLAYPLAHA